MRRKLDGWFMYDCHLFARINMDAPDHEVVARVMLLFAEDGCGSVFLRDAGNSTLGNPDLSLSGRPLGPDFTAPWGVTHEQVLKWLANVRAFQELDPYLECG